MLTYYLNAEYTISGYMIDNNGLPTKDISVNLYSKHKYQSGEFFPVDVLLVESYITDNNGYFEFTRAFDDMYDFGSTYYHYHIEPKNDGWIYRPFGLLYKWPLSNDSTGHIFTPVVYCNPTSIDFGEIKINEISTKAFSIIFLSTFSSTVVGEFYCDESWISIDPEQFDNSVNVNVTIDNSKLGKKEGKYDTEIGIYITTGETGIL
ncbi:unnamed protein product, partial [marine sediment metagenome]